jgi:flagellar hook-length control protein FliK
VGQTPALSVHPVVGGSEWGPALGQQMIRMSTSGHHVAELSLNPAGLGPLKVTLTIGDNQAQALFVSAHEGVRNAIEAALPQLRKTLADHGINLGQTSVGAESQQPPRQGGTFGQHPSGRSTPPDYPGPDRLDTVAIAEPLLTGLPSALRRPSAGVDTFA